MFILQCVARTTAIWSVQKCNVWRKRMSVMEKKIVPMHWTNIAVSPVAFWHFLLFLSWGRPQSVGLTFVLFPGFPASVSKACFLCGDGTCIVPKQPLYSVEYGKKWWWLCDGWNHCQDGTDERMGKSRFLTLFFSAKIGSEKNSSAVYLFIYLFQMSVCFWRRAQMQYFSAKQQSAFTRITPLHYWRHSFVMECSIALIMKTKSTRSAKESQVYTKNFIFKKEVQ